MIIRYFIMNQHSDGGFEGDNCLFLFKRREDPKPNHGRVIHPQAKDGQVFPTVLYPTRCLDDLLTFDLNQYEIRSEF